jgi:hypothetical protein
LISLDPFEPRDLQFNYEVILANKTKSAKSLVMFHKGPSTQETIFGEAKTNVAVDALPSSRLAGNQICTLCGMLTHNLCREIQMRQVDAPVARRTPHRPHRADFPQWVPQA